MTLQSYRVLIVDDNIIFANTLSALVRVTLGNRLSAITLAINGEDAVEKALNDNNYDVIFMDVNMPKMDGVTAAQIINRRLYRQTRIVAISFLKDMNTVTRMIEAGAETFLYKDNLTVESIEEIFN
ncbi:MAG: response regulator [Bacteroidales bacterium]|nr:response regulator [Bacteroidales bacterium]MDD4383625.1 response regulator [Bacteroidales bacterium]MDY0197293.1 response regulator [Tenuifilaceae bacterium]